jgi:thioredoxin 1
MDDESLEKALEESWYKPVLVVFGAPWCGACKLMEPSVEELAERMGKNAIVGKIDAQKNASLADRYGATGLPSIYVFREGRIAKKVVGAHDVTALEKLIKAQEGSSGR